MNRSDDYIDPRETWKVSDAAMRLLEQQPKMIRDALFEMIEREALTVHLQNMHELIHLTWQAAAQKV